MNVRAGRRDEMIYLRDYIGGSSVRECYRHPLFDDKCIKIVKNKKDEILRCNLVILNLDASYYLNGSEAGKLNAFEEYIVRKLTNKILSGDIPENLDVFFDHEIMNLRTRR